jgi:hypothetical protein
MRTVRNRRPLLPLSLTGPAALVALLVLAGACTSDDDDSTDRGSSADLESEGGALDADQVQDEIAGLLVDYDHVVNQIIADPQVTKNPDDPLVAQYLDLFEPDSDFADQALDTWRNNADEGITIEPYDDEHPANVTRLDGDVEIVGDDEVRFPTCSEFRQLVHQGGRVVEGLPFMEQPGESVVVRHDDDWVFRRRDVFTDVPECATDDPDDPAAEAGNPTETSTENPTENPTESQTEGATEGN